MTADWATWALQFLIVLGIGRVWLAIDNNTKELSDLREEIPKTYATVKATDRHHDEDATRFAATDASIVALRERVYDVDLRLTEVAGGVVSARAQLK